MRTSSLRTRRRYRKPWTLTPAVIVHCFTLLVVFISLKSNTINSEKKGVRFAISVPVVRSKYTQNMEAMRHWPSACEKGRRYNVGLIFVINNLNDTSSKNILHELTDALGRNKGCFKDIQISNADLLREEETYPNSANLMFYSTFKVVKESLYEAFFWMEHDVIPLSENWLDKLYFDVVCYERDYVMLGSLPMGDDWASINLKHPSIWMDHINGAALYSTDKDAGDFLDIVRATGLRYPHFAWDALISMIFYQWLYDGNQVSWNFRVKYAPKYRYHEFVYNNLGQKKIPATLPEKTLFVHGNGKSMTNALF